MKDNAQAPSLKNLLEEGARFKRLLTTDVQLSSLEAQLRESMVPMDPSDPEAFANACTGPGIYQIDSKFPFSTWEELEAWGDIRGADRRFEGAAGDLTLLP